MNAAAVAARRRASLERLRVAGARAPLDGDPVPEDARIDLARPFLCPTAVPLQYTSAAERLSPEQLLRANQLTGLHYNEVITYFETALAPAALAALSRATPDPALRECLAGFLADEARHTAMFQRLNRLSAPGWYDQAPFRFLVLPPGLRQAIALVTRRAAWFPALLWIMLAAEEHSVEVSRRSAAVASELEPTWAAAYRAHALDEVRHVQIDLHLVDRFHSPRGRRERRANAAVVRFVLGHLLLAPGRSGERVLAQLGREFPEARGAAAAMRSELRALGACPAYQAMMYSRETTPLTFALFDRFPEFRRMERVLSAYRAGAPA
jgi:hypothetical protein